MDIRRKYRFITASVQITDSGDARSRMGMAGVNRQYTPTTTLHNTRPGSDPLIVAFHRNFIHCQLLDSRALHYVCLLYTSPSPRDRTRSRMPSSA